MKRTLLLALTLVACRPAPETTWQQTKGDMMFSAQQLDEAIRRRLSQRDFREIDCVKFYGDVMKRAPGRCYVSKLTRDEVLDELSALLEPHVESMPWADDYGQYHGGFTLKSEPSTEVGLAISVLKPKTDTFKAAPEILRDYQTDVIYTAPLPKVNP